MFMELTIVKVTQLEKTFTLKNYGTLNTSSGAQFLNPFRQGVCTVIY